VKCVTLAAWANSSLVTSSSIPEGTLCPTPCARFSRIAASRCGAVWQVRLRPHEWLHKR
jgi:hypothetical protein